MKKVILTESTLAEMIKQRLREKHDTGNIFWKHVTPDMKVVDNGGSYTADNKLVNWESRDAARAQYFLDKLAKKAESTKAVDEDIEDDNDPLKDATYSYKPSAQVIPTKAYNFTEEEAVLIEKILNQIEADDSLEEKLLFSIKAKLRP